jgi:hypothetical protein
MTRWRRRALWVVGSLAAVVLLLIVASFFIDEPLRRSMEREVNRRLDGYSARITKLDFHPIGFSIDLEDVIVTQNAHPDPPVAHIRQLSASVEWRALLRLRLVADFRFVEPKLFIDREHLVKEAKDEVPIDQRGWQEALAAIYPLKIDTFTVENGEITYVDKPGDQILGKPLTVSRLNIRTRNIRNILSPDHVYPSDVHIDAAVFDRGRFTLDGQADFLAIPHPGVDAQLALEHIDLGTFEPVLRQFNLALRKGVLFGKGKVEYAPHVKIVHLEEVRLEGFDGDLVHTAASAPKEKKAAKAAGEAAEQVSNQPDVLLRVDRALVRNGTFGFVNKTARQPYRVFLSGANIDVTNLSNQEAEGPSTFKLVGKFMGSGDTLVSGKFKAAKAGPEMDVSAQIENTDMRSMNDLLRAHARMDVVAGVFSVYSEVGVHDRRIRGYVKPLFSDLDVYDPEQDRDKPFMRKAYEKVAEGVSKLLRNRPRREVATRADIEGSLGDAKANMMQVALRLIENAFFKAILPGFEQVARGGRGRDRAEPAAASPR